MKITLIILDGIADTINNSCLQKAHIPNLNYLASNSLCGLMYPIKNIAPESGEAQFSILGQNLKNYPGRGPLEALGLRIELKEKQIALRANFAKINGNKLINLRENIPNKSIIKKLNKIDKDIKIIPHNIYRAILIINNASPNITNTHPNYIKYHNISKSVLGKKIKKLCKGDKKTAKKINNFISKAEKIMKNKTILLRGPGTRIKKLNNMRDWNIIADMPVELGLGKMLGMHILPRKNEFKQIINTKSNLYVQIKGPDIYSHLKDSRSKIKEIEKIDKLLKQIINIKNRIICITADHATPCSIGIHTKDPVPFLIYNKTPNNIKEFTEKACSKGLIIQGKDLLKTINSTT
jgi:2,3-bisphosphoglycerate-independent phosphoglycerate mutase